MKTGFRRDHYWRPRRWLTVGCIASAIIGFMLSCSALGLGMSSGPGVSWEAGFAGVYLLRNDAGSGQPDPDHHYVGLRATCHRAPRFSRMLGDQHFVIWSCP